MSKVLYIQELKDLDKTFDLCRLRAQKERTTVVAFRRANGTGSMIPTMEFNIHGDMAEVPAKPLHVSMADGLLNQFVKRYNHDSKRGQADLATVAGWLKWYEKNGGTI